MREGLTYTDLFASDADKSKPEYGVKVAETIAREWFDGGLIQAGCNYDIRRDWIRRRRIFALGQQDLKPYKDFIAREQNDLSYYNLDWRPVNILGKFNKIVSDGIDEESYDIGVKALDENAVKSRQAYEKQLRKNLVSRKIRQDALQLMGIDLRPSTFVPDDEEDLEMHMMLRQKSKVEIAEESLIENVFASNEFVNITITQLLI